MFCYKIRVPCTNHAKDTYSDKKSKTYIDAEDGYIYVTGTLPRLAQQFPDAISIEKLGPGYVMHDEEEK